MRMQINFDPEDVARVKLLLDDIDANRVMIRAINDTLAGVNTDAARAVYADLNLTQTRIKEDFSIRRAYTGNVNGAFTATGRPVNLASFTGSRMTTRGLSVKIKRAGTRVTFRHGFLWNRTTRTGESAATAFQREWQGARTNATTQLPWKQMGQQYRLPLETMTGPRIEDILSKPEVIGPLEIAGGDRLEAAVDHELEYILSRH